MRHGVSRWRRAGWIAAGVIVWMGGIPMLGQSVGGGPKPLDPLTPQEEALAVRSAVSAGKSQSLLRDESPRVGAILLQGPDKTAKGDGDVKTSSRRAIVLLYDRATKSGARVIVDLASGEARESVKIAATEVPLGWDDLADAWALAQRDDAVRKLLGASFERYQLVPRGISPDKVEFGVQGMAIHGATAKDACWQRRCLALLFRSEHQYLEGVEVLVDLTEGKVSVRRAGSEGKS